MQSLTIPARGHTADAREHRARSRSEVRALAERAQRGDPRPQLPGARGAGRGRLRRRLPRPLAQGGGHRRGRDRLLRRALHGRDRLDPEPGEDRAAARPRRRLLARRLDHGRPAARLEGRAPRRDRGDVREHHRRGEGRDRLLLHVVQRRRRSSSTSAASTARTPRSCSAPTCCSAPTWSGSPAGGCRSGRASATCTPASARPTSPTCARPTPAPSS